jgi:hypothetical protein
MLRLTQALVQNGQSEGRASWKQAAKRGVGELGSTEMAETGPVAEPETGDWTSGQGPETGLEPKRGRGRQGARVARLAWACGEWGWYGKACGNVRGDVQGDASRGLSLGDGEDPAEDRDEGLRLARHRLDLPNELACGVLPVWPSR